MNNAVGRKSLNSPHFQFHGNLSYFENNFYATKREYLADFDVFLPRLLRTSGCFSPMHLLIRDGSIVASVYEKAEKEYGISTEREDITEL